VEILTRSKVRSWESLRHHPTDLGGARLKLMQRHESAHSSKIIKHKIHSRSRTCCAHECKLNFLLPSIANFCNIFAHNYLFYMQNRLSQMPSHTFSSQCMTLPCCAPVAWASSCWEMKLEFCLMIWKKHFGFVYGSASQDNVSLQSYTTQVDGVTIYVKIVVSCLC
jgi:hypothetical protein